MNQDVVITTYQVLAGEYQKGNSSFITTPWLRYYLLFVLEFLEFLLVLIDYFS